jgi:NAD(P)-dependent dehydrogenase (short-subunit alcohol dehydrogenase family)
MHGGPLLAGQTVVVTGAGGGIGAGIALACGRAGAHVVVAARRAATGDEIAAVIRARGGSALSVPCDVTRARDVDGAIAESVARFGRLDAVVHNALSDVGARSEIEALDDDIVDGMVATAVRASYLCARAAYPELRRTSGTLVLVTSSSGIEGSPYLPSYAMVKGAQRGLVKSLAREWGPDRIRVNAIAPVARTPAMERTFAANPLVAKMSTERLPLRRIGEPEDDIGAVAVFLLSSLARYVTGQTVVADGGGFPL